jgi:hypothetical protein
MIAVCARCGLRSTITPVDWSNWNARLPKGFKVLCPYLKEPQHANDDDCPNLSAAELATFDAWLRRMNQPTR